MSMVNGRGTTEEDPKVYQWIMELMQGGNRETALLELSKKREQVDDLALILWHSVGTVAFLFSLKASANHGGDLWRAVI